MEVVPAIDIRGGKCVRLYQGDYGQETVYDDDPVRVARRWADLGAARLHVVDLDGAKSGVPVNIDIVGGIARAVETPVQFGGGIRTLDAVKEVVAMGVSRVIIGTAAINAPGLVAEARRELGEEALLVSVDARNGFVVGQGWTQASRVSASKMVERIASAGVRRFIYTDVLRVSTLTEPNYRAIEDLAGLTELGMLVAGGISSVDHLRRLSRLGIEAAIVGTAIYTGDIDLPEAMAAVRNSSNNLS